MNNKHTFFWLANGYVLSGLLGGLGLGVMAGPQLRQWLPIDQSTVMIGMSLISISAIAIGVLNLKYKNVDIQRTS